MKLQTTRTRASDYFNCNRTRTFTSTHLFNRSLLVAGAVAGLLSLTEQSQGSLLFSETFESGLGSWDLVRPHLSTDGGVLRGNGDGNRGAMFRAAVGADELSFSFYRTKNAGTSEDGGDHIEVGLTEGQTVNFYNAIDASNSVHFNFDARSNPQGDASFEIHGGAGNLIGRWRIQDAVLDGMWYDALIRLLPTHEAVFGYKLAGASDFTTSPIFALPPGFVSSYAGVTAYRVPNNGATGIARLDNVAAFVVPEPAAAVLAALAITSMLFRIR